MATIDFPTPDCPLCGHPPLPLIIPVAQRFCQNEECSVFSWDPTQTREQFLATARDLQLQDKDGLPIWLKECEQCGREIAVKSPDTRVTDCSAHQ